MSDLNAALNLTTPTARDTGAGLRMPARLGRARGVAMTVALAMTPLMMLAGAVADWRTQSGPQAVEAGSAAIAAPAVGRDVAQAPSPR